MVKRQVDWISLLKRGLRDMSLANLARQIDIEAHCKLKESIG